MNMIKPLKNPTTANLLAWPTDPKLTRDDPNPSPDAVVLQAYLIYERQGRPQGCDIQHWLEAFKRKFAQAGAAR